MADDPYASAEYRRNRLITLDTYGHQCWRCGKPATTADHIIPVSKGGSHALENLRAACVTCNTSRGNRMEDRTPWLDPAIKQALGI